MISKDFEGLDGIIVYEKYIRIVALVNSAWVLPKHCYPIEIDLYGMAIFNKLRDFEICWCYVMIQLKIVQTDPIFFSGISV